MVENSLNCVEELSCEEPGSELDKTWQANMSVKNVKIHSTSMLSAFISHLRHDVFKEDVAIVADATTIRCLHPGISV